MGLLKESGIGWLSTTFSCIEEGERTVVRATDNDITVLVVEDHSAQGRGWRESLLGGVRVVQIPNVGVQGHLWWHLLEAENGVRNTDFQVRDFRVPADLGNGTSHWVRVLEDHHSLG